VTMADDERSSLDQVNDWIEANSRRVFWVAVVLALPYLVLCNALAITIASALLGAGGSCG